jgi:hypothetical protein
LITLPGALRPYQPAEQAAQMDWRQAVRPPQAGVRACLGRAVKQRVQVPRSTRRAVIQEERDVRRAGVLCRGWERWVRVRGVVVVVREGRMVTRVGRRVGLEAQVAVEIVWKRERLVRGVGRVLASLRRSQAVPFSAARARGVVSVGVMVLMAGTAVQAGQV